MKKYCNMIDDWCSDQFVIGDEWNLEDCIHPDLLPLYKDNPVPDYVGAGWTRGKDDVWSDIAGVKWPNGIPSGPTPFDPNYTGPWPIPKEETEAPEEQSE